MTFETHFNKAALDSSGNGKIEKPAEDLELRLKSSVIEELEQEIGILFTHNEILQKYFAIPKLQGTPNDYFDIMIHGDQSTLTTRSPAYKKNNDLWLAMKALLYVQYKKEIKAKKIVFIPELNYEIVRVQAKKEIEERMSKPPKDMLAFKKALEQTPSYSKQAEHPAIVELEDLMKNREEKKTKFDLEILDSIYLQIVRSLLLDRKLIPGTDYQMSIPSGSTLLLRITTDLKTEDSPLGNSAIRAFLREKFSIDAVEPYFYLEVERRNMHGYSIPLNVTDEYERRKEVKDSAEKLKVESEMFNRNEELENKERPYDTEVLRQIRKRIITLIESDSTLKEGVNFAIRNPTGEWPTLQLVPVNGHLRNLEVKKSTGEIISLYEYLQGSFKQTSESPYFPVRISINMKTATEAVALGVTAEYEKITGKKIEKKKTRGLGKKI